MAHDVIRLGGARNSKWHAWFATSASLLYLCTSFLFVLPVDAERDAILFCGACIALVEELNWQTGVTNPKLKIQVGSFHLDAKGNSGAREIPLATSETYLTEIYENVCRYMYYYAKAIGNNGNTNYIRTSSRDGQQISTKDVEVSQEIRDNLQFACDWVLEEYDDWMVPLYNVKDKEVATKLCVEKAGLCTASNLTDHMWTYAGAVMAGQRERGLDDRPPNPTNFGEDWKFDEDEEEIFADDEENQTYDGSRSEL